MRRPMRRGLPRIGFAFTIVAAYNLAPAEAPGRTCHRKASDNPVVGRWRKLVARPILHALIQHRAGRHP